ncbi:MAG TPA: endonuclease/exonuclease/phosphatase family protein [Amaricoccus sp.]|nr:endonuclease/exonuclease/phosphatase family protein [Amaricoccus sp.]
MRALLLTLLLAAPAAADTLRVATWDAGLSRDGPGLLLADLADRHPQALAAVEIVQAVRPDILLLTGFDDDRRGLALAAFRALLAEGPRALAYPHAFHAQVNAGEPSFRDLDGDGRSTGWGDAWGWGKFPGHGGMALLSQFPLAGTRSFRLHPWRGDRRLSSRAHWDVAVLLPDGRRLHLLAASPTPPLFAAENADRNADEITFWIPYLSGTPVTDDAGLSAPLADAPAVVLGNLNLDPHDGAGRPEAVAALLAHPRLQDPRPASAGAAAAADPGHAGPPALDTADWPGGDGAGNLRTDYVLPSRDLAVAASGVAWPAPGAPLAAAAAAASPHRLVWVDLTLP